VKDKNFSIPKELSSRYMRNIPNSCKFRCMNNVAIMTALVNGTISNYRGLTTMLKYAFCYCILRLNLYSLWSQLLDTHIFVYPTCVIITSVCWSEARVVLFIPCLTLAAQTRVHWLQSSYTRATLHLPALISGNY
jgi:hypothetical protein